ncbi:MLP-like protein 34 [Punica granatum]|uniref:Bet v I/Major latex protein domain-containing protein n=2 Tax=Punica granatum TaxID=22663 RepID=A0A218W5K8_PUNGR|nr:MLP-like protein 34 [Punica granatum]OWM67823.1 hypothetical protein CDL15_Pgr010761 [Punica granatum]PKI78177.1 hypothetical protein CRG98_001505 [Punica granatum]
MALTGKLEEEVEIVATADVFYNLFKTQIHQLPNICSDVVQKVELHEGDWTSSGAVRQWNYTLDGKALTTKEKVELDDASRAVTFNLLEGDVFTEFKSIKANVQATPKALGIGSVVKWTIEYEKLSEDIAEPSNYLTAAVKMTQDIGAHLVSA